MKKAIALAIVLISCVLAWSAIDIVPVNVGTTVNDYTGDSIRSAFLKVNSNFTAVTNSMIGFTNTALRVTRASTNRYSAYEVGGCPDSTFNGIYRLWYTTNRATSPYTYGTVGIYTNGARYLLLNSSPTNLYVWHTAVLQTNTALTADWEFPGLTSTVMYYNGDNANSQVGIRTHSPSGSNTWSYANPSVASNVPSMYMIAYDTNRVGYTLASTNFQGDFYTSDGRPLTQLTGTDPTVFSTFIYHAFGVPYTNSTGSALNLRSQAALTATNSDGRVGLTFRVSDIIGQTNQGDTIVSAIAQYPMTNRVSIPTRAANTAAGNHYSVFTLQVPAGSVYSFEDVSTGTGNAAFLLESVASSSAPLNMTNFNWEKSLSRSIATNFLTITNKAPAVTNVTVAMNLLMASGWGSSNAVWNTNSSFWGKTGLTALSIMNRETNGSLTTDQARVAITKRHVYLRGHGSGTSGMISNNTSKLVFFLTTNNSLVVRTEVASICRVQSGPTVDYAIGILDADLPDTVAVIPMVTNQWIMTDSNHVEYTGNFTSKVNWGKSFSHPVVALGACQHGYIGVLSSSGTDGVLSPLADHYIYEGGDSGNANLYVINDTLVMVNGRSTTGFDSNMLADIDALTVLRGLNTNSYRVTGFDTSKFPPMFPLIPDSP